MYSKDKRQVYLLFILMHSYYYNHISVSKLIT